MGEVIQFRPAAGQLRQPARPMGSPADLQDGERSRLSILSEATFVVSLSQALIRETRRRLARSRLALAAARRTLTAERTGGGATNHGINRQP